VNLSRRRVLSSALTRRSSCSATTSNNR